VVSPFGGETYVAFPALVPDVAIMHVAWADREGNAVLGGNWALDRELAVVAKRVILTAEEVRDGLEGEIDIFSLSVDALVHLPGGARPTSCYPHYALDGEALLDYVDACGRGEFEAYLERFIRDEQPR
jgi:glutaconate CoA-transferase subunit A